MTAKYRVGKTSKDEYENFLKKADEFCEMMRQSLDKEKWNAAGLNAIHSGISANDAVLNFFFGLGEIPFAINEK